MASGARRYEALDSLRGVCACMIVVFHLETTGAISRSAFVQNAWLFVDFFFVLSGFVITESYGRRLVEGFSTARFMALRLGRVYPLHLVMLLAFLAFELAYAAGWLGAAPRPPFTGIYDWRGFVTSLFLVQVFVGPDAVWWNVPSWSIAVEVWTYLLAALFVRYVRVGVVGWLVVVLAVCAAVMATGTARYISVYHDGALARCVYGFVLGALASRFKDVAAVLLPACGAAATAVEVAVAAAVVAFVTLVSASPWSLAASPLFAAAVLVFAGEGGRVSALLARPLPRMLGTLSYSIYMTHGFVVSRILNGLSLVEQRTGTELVSARGGQNVVGLSPGFGDLMSVATLVVVVAVAWVTYRLVERPGQRWSRALVLGERPRRIVLEAEREVPTF